MKSVLNLDKLVFRVLPARYPALSEKRFYHLAYDCWYSVWAKTLKVDFNQSDKLYSDEFTRQDEITCLFHEDECVSVTGVKYHDLRDKVSLDDSYFSHWPELTLAHIKKFNPRVMVLNNLALNFSYRRRAYNISWTDLIYVMNVFHLKHMGRDAMIGTPRAEKGLPEVAARTGARILVSHLPYSLPGAHIALVLWPRQLKLSSLDVGTLALALKVWSNSKEQVGLKKSS
jgi:hypothetical protein